MSHVHHTVEENHLPMRLTRFMTWVVYVVFREGPARVSGKLLLLESGTLDARKEAGTQTSPRS